MERITIADLKVGMHILCRCCGNHSADSRSEFRPCIGCICMVGESEKDSLFPLEMRILSDLDTTRMRVDLPCVHPWDGPDTDNVHLLTKEEFVAYLL